MINQIIDWLTNCACVAVLVLGILLAVCLKRLDNELKP